MTNDLVAQSSNSLVPPAKTWNTTDSTKLKAYMACPRKYWFEYVLGWRSTYPNNHLIFGKAWHIAMEHLLLHGYSEDSIIDAWDKLVIYYRTELGEDTDPIYEPKTPLRALAALSKYCAHHHEDNFEVIYTEIGGSVAISDVNLLTFLIDGVIKDNERYFVLEHKTKGGSMTPNWKDSWLLDNQVSTYAFALYCMFPEADIGGVIVNGTGFLKTKIDIGRVPVYKTRKHMQVWLQTANYYMNDMKREFAFMNECSDSDPVFEAFPMCLTSCGDYGGCIYRDYCLAWANPLRHCEEPPIGMQIDHWDPLDHETTQTFELTAGQM